MYRRNSALDAAIITREILRRDYREKKPKRKRRTLRPIDYNNMIRPK